VEPTCWCRYPIALQDPILDTSPRHLRDIQNIPVLRRHSESTLDYWTDFQHPDSRGIKDLVKSYPPYGVNGCRPLLIPPWMSPSRAVINPILLAISPRPERSTCGISGSVCHFPSFRTAIQVRILSEYTRRSLGLKCYLSQHCYQFRGRVGAMGRFINARSLYAFDSRLCRSLEQGGQLPEGEFGGTEN
jgi:hypothetical protein